MKLNLGCDTHRIEGYINIDLKEELKPDMVVDVTEGLPFENDSIEEIRMEHFLEHPFYIQVEPLLRECWRVLRPEGELAVEVPDILKICKLLLEGKKSLEFCLAGIYGGYAGTKIDVPQMHKWGWTAETLKEIMEKTGFEIMEVGEGRFSSHYPERDTFIWARKK